MAKIVKNIHYNSLQNKIKIPDLRGRVIIGTNTTEFNDTNNNKISVRVLNQTGGMEKVKLTIDEMPSHNHDIAVSQNNDYWTGPNRPTFGLLGTAQKVYDGYSLPKGGDKPHENMQPFMVLNYIMKQPIKA